MSKCAMVGCGKLGLPVAMAWATQHEMVGYDVSPAAKEIIASRKYPHREVGAQDLLKKTTLRIVDTIDEAVAHGEIVFVAVQTPHQPEFEGTTRMPEHRADFDYTSLKAAVKAVADSAKAQKKPIVLVVISTVLPGTSQRELYPLLEDNAYVSYVYSPMFIAMGTTIDDALNPEFVLLGVDKNRSGHALEIMQQFYDPLHDADLMPMSVPSAELAKVAYNVFLGLKIVAANAVMEIAHKIGNGCNCDEVSDALAKATDRVVSSKYMRGGMGDGGGCHPRDQIALSWLAQKLNLSYDLFGEMVKAREAQTEWLAELMQLERQDIGAGTRQFVILGKAYKKGTNLTVGSPAILLNHILAEQDIPLASFHWDPHVDDTRETMGPSIILIGTNHDEFYSMKFPIGSTIIDPWGKLPEQAGCKVIRVGRHS